MGNEEKLKEVENAKKSSKDPNEIANLSKDEFVLKQELKRAHELYWKEAAFFNRVFRSRLSKIVGAFLL